MTPAADTATPALTGAALDTFLNRLDADLEEAESGEAIQLAERLRAQPLQPDSIEAIERLYRLWINADDVPAAFAVLDLDGARVRDAAAPDARADVRMRIELCRLRIGQFRHDEALSCRAIAALRAIVGEEAQLDPVRYRQLRLYENVESTQPAAALELAELQHALALVSPDRTTFRAWDAADRERRRAQALRRLGRADEARAAGEAAVAALAAAGADQDVDENDWFWIGESVIDVAPAVLGTIAPAVTARVADWPAAARPRCGSHGCRRARRARWAIWIPRWRAARRPASRWATATATISSNSNCRG